MGPSRLLLMLLFLPIALSLTLIQQCPFTADIPNELYVVVDGDGTADGVLRCSSLGTGIVVRANNTTIDFNGTLVYSSPYDNQLEVTEDYYVRILNTPRRAGWSNGPLVVRGHVWIENSSSYGEIVIADGLRELHLLNSPITVRIDNENVSLCDAILDSSPQSIFAVYCHAEGITVNLSQTPFVYLYNVTNATIIGSSWMPQGVYFINSRSILVENATLFLPGGDFPSPPYAVCFNSEGIVVRDSFLDVGFSFVGCRDISIESSDTLPNALYYQPLYFFRDSSSLLLRNTRYHSLKLYNLSNALLSNISIFNPNPGDWWGMTHTPAFIVESPYNVTFRDSDISSLLGVALSDPADVAGIRFEDSTYYGRPIYDVRNAHLSLEGDNIGFIVAENATVEVRNAPRVSDAFFIWALNSNISLYNITAQLEEGDEDGTTTGYGLFQLVTGRDVNVHVELLRLGNFSPRALHGLHSEGVIVLYGRSNATVRHTWIGELFDGRLEKAALITADMGFNSIRVGNLSGSTPERLFWLYSEVEPSNASCFFANVTLSNGSFGLVECEAIEMENVAWRGSFTNLPLVGSGSSNFFTFHSFIANNLSWVDERAMGGEVLDNGIIAADAFQLNPYTSAIFGYAPATFSLANASINGTISIAPYSVPSFRVNLTITRSSINGGRGPALSVAAGSFTGVIEDSSLMGGGGLWWDGGYTLYPDGAVVAGLLHFQDSTTSLAIRHSFLQGPHLVSRAFRNQPWWDNEPLSISIEGSVLNTTVAPYQGALLFSTSPNAAVAAIPSYSIGVRDSLWLQPILELNNSSVVISNESVYNAFLSYEGLYLSLDNITFKGSSVAKGIGTLERGHLQLSNIFIPWEDAERADVDWVNVTVLNDSFVGMENITLSIAGGVMNLTFFSPTVSREGSGPYGYLLLNPFAADEATYSIAGGRYYVAVNESFEPGFDTNASQLSLYLPNLCSFASVRYLPFFASLQEVLEQGILLNASCDGDVLLVRPSP